MIDLSATTAGRIVGGLFIAAFFLYGGGAYLLDSVADGATPLPENAASLGELSAGAALMLANSVAVIVIGALAFRVLRRGHSRTAGGYLLVRAVEGGEVRGDLGGHGGGLVAGHRSPHHFVIVTVVPRPTSDTIANSSINRRAPGSPSPSP